MQQQKPAERADDWNKGPSDQPSRRASRSPSSPPTSGLAIASLVCGVAGFFFCGIPAIAGLILGIVALSKIASSKGELGGKGLAIAGTVVSAVTILVGIVMAGIWAAMLIPALSRARAEAQKAACMSNLNQIGIAITMYRRENAQQWPDSLEDLHPDYIQSREVFRCPATDRDAHDGPGHYIYQKPSGTQDLWETPIVFDAPNNHEGGRCVLFGDAHVEWQSDSQPTLVPSEPLKNFP